MNIPARPTRALRADVGTTSHTKRLSAPGRERCVNEQPVTNKGFYKAKRECKACRGAGLTPDPTDYYRTTICGGCNGRGYVRQWRK